jgi:hypothetical protein
VFEKEIGKIALAVYDVIQGEAPHCPYLPIAIMVNLPIPSLLKHSILAFETVVAPMSHEER